MSKRFCLFAVAIFVVICCLNSTSTAATYTVTKIADTNDGVCDADCSLREAITTANGTADNDAIIFSSTAFAAAQIIVLGGSELNIADNGTLIITGSIAPLSISANNSSRVLNIAANANVTLNYLTITGGNSNFTIGGGIYNSGLLNINNSIISQNINVTGGGAIASSGTLNLTNSTISGNSSETGGGIYNSGNLNLTNVTISGNHGETGGGIYNYPARTVNAGNSIIAGNTMFIGGDIDGNLNSLGHNLIGNTSGSVITGTTTGNILNVNPNLGVLQNNGGPTNTYAFLPGSPAINVGSNALAVDTNNQSLSNDQRGFRRFIGTVDIGAFEENTQPFLTIDTTSSNGALSACTTAANDCSLRGAIILTNSRPDTETIQFDSTVFDGTKTISLGGSELAFTKSGILTINGTGANRLTISAGNSSRIFNVHSGANVTITGLAITQGRGFSAFGGGIANSGILYLKDSTVSNCNANGGGGIFNEGTLTLSSSTVFNNSTFFKGGGGVLNHHLLNLFNSTISGNTTVSIGGGLSIDYGGTIRLTNSTIYGNSSSGEGGGVYGGFNTIYSRNSIIAGNSSDSSTGSHNFYGTLTSQGYNLFGFINGYGYITGDATGNIYNVDPLLGQLQNNGGTTLTHAPSISSPIINAGSNVLALDSNNQPLTFDQRGTSFPRIFGGTVDIGAFESDIFLNLRVDTVSDSGSLSACTNSANDCSLRGAVSRANSTSGRVIISFEALGTIPQTILTTSELAISNSGTLTILGSGVNLLTINGNNTHRVFNISSGSNVNMSDLTITQGRIFGNGGGGVLNNGNLTLTNTVLNANTSNTGSGLSNFGNAIINNSAITNNTGDLGGGLYNNSNSLTVINSTLSGNSAASYGGGICNNTGITKIINSTIFNNSADIGGGIYQLSTGTVSVGNSIIAGNVGGFQTPDFRGNLTSLGYNLIGNTTDTTISGSTTGNHLNVNPLLTSLQNNGGTTLTHGLLTNSPAINAGSNALALDSENQMLIYDQRGIGFGRFADGRVDIGATEMPGSLYVINTNNSGIGSLRQIIETANLTNYPEIIKFYIPGNDAGCINGICNISFSGSALSIQNVQTSGWLSIDNSNGRSPVQITGTYQSFSINSGAVVTIKNLIFNNRADIINQGSLDIYDTSFLVNTTVESWGNLTIENSVFKANGGTSGITNGGTATVRNTTISGAGNVNYGGAIRNYGVFDLTNATISGNSSAQSGGGIHNTGTFNLTNSTVAGNTTQTFGGGIYVYSGTFNSRNSIVADNTSGNSGPDIYGTLTSQGNNLVAIASGATISGNTAGNKLNQDARLAPLGYYGGTMQTHALLSGSPAINAGNSATSPTLDQRGAARIGSADIGAFELNNSTNGGNFIAPLTYGRQFSSYDFQLTNNSSNATFAVTSGSLPNGVSLISNISPNATIALSGTPTQNGIFNFSVTATDASNSHVTNYSLSILGPTAAGVGVTGKVLISEGIGLHNAIVTMTDSNGNIRRTKTGTFGNFAFDNVEAGQTYVVQVVSKRFSFETQIVNITEEIFELRFFAN